MALVRVNELRAQKSLATRHFDDMDDWLEEQEGLGLQQTLAMLQVRHNSSRQPSLRQQASRAYFLLRLWRFLMVSTPPASSMGCCSRVCWIVNPPLTCCCLFLHCCSYFLLPALLMLQEPDETSNYAIVWNAYPGLKSPSSSPLARVSPAYGALCSVAGVPSDSPSTYCDGRSSSSFSSSSSVRTKIGKLWGKCKRKLASKHSSTQQSSLRSSSSSGALTSSSAPSSRRSSSTSSDSSFLTRSSSSGFSGFSSSPASSAALDYPSPLHSVLSSSPGACVVPTPEALAQQAQHWQHALSAMAGLSRWWTG